MLDVLNGLIDTARQENPTLQIAGLAILESRALLGIATGSKYPQVQQASGSYARVDSWPTEGENDWDRSDLNQYNVGFDVAWEIDFWGRWRRGIESADAAFFASITNQQNAQVLLASQVAQAYYAVVGENLMKFAHQNHYAGIVVNGYIRDTFQIQDIPVALYALGTCSRKYIPVTGGERNAPVSFGGITFTPGDYLYGDTDGVIVTPEKLV